MYLYLKAFLEGFLGNFSETKDIFLPKSRKNFFERGLKLFTTFRNKMKNKLIEIKDKVLLRKRVLVETVNDQLKNISQLEHTSSTLYIFMINSLALVDHKIGQEKS